MTLHPPIYLDANATLPAHPAAIEAATAQMRVAANASSVHRFGQQAKQVLQQASQAIKQALGASGAEIVLTSGATEANHLALQALPQVQSLLVSAIEHPSVLQPALQQGATQIPVNSQGVVDLEALEQLLTEAASPALVSVMLANNETGVIQPIKEIAALVFAHRGFMHCDAVQAVGKIPLDFGDLGVDMLSISAHKFGGIPGAGALLYKKGLSLRPMMHGGGQQSGLRPGTENLPAMVAMEAALKEANPQAYAAQVQPLRDSLEAALLEVAPDMVIAGKEAARLPNTSCLTMPGMAAEAQLIAFDLAGFAVSSGSACSSGTVRPSHVLLAMGYDEAVTQHAIRVSLHEGTTKEEIEAFVQAWCELHQRSATKKKAA